MILYLVRHGIAIDRDDPDCPSEAERHLTREGIARAEQAMAGLGELGAHPGAILTSPFVRAAQTARIAAEAWKLDPKGIKTTEALLPSADPMRLLAELAKLRVDQVACFGHAPHIDEAIARLTGASDTFTAVKKSGVAQLDVREPRPGGGVLLALYPPGSLRRIS